VRPAANLPHTPARIELVIPRVGIGLEGTLKLGEKPLGPVGFVRGRRIEDDLPPERVEICPEPAFETPPAIVQYRHGRVIRLEIDRGRDLAAQLRLNRRQGRRHIRHPSTQGGTGEIDPLAREDPLEPMQRQVVDVFRDDDMCEQPLTGEGLLDGLRRRGRFHDPFVTVGARVFRARRFDHDETRR
jgi:hypothetical protein